MQSDDRNITVIFWPSSFCKRPNSLYRNKNIKDRVDVGYIVGWNIQSFIVCATCVVHDTPLEKCERVLEEILEEGATVGGDVQNPFVEHMSKTCQVQPAVLGVVYYSSDGGVTLTGAQPPVVEETAVIQDRRQNASIWLTIDMDTNSFPRLQNVYCCGYKNTNISPQIFFYNPPDPYYLESFSLTPLLLETTNPNPNFFSIEDFKLKLKSTSPLHEVPIQRFTLHTLKSKYSIVNNSLLTSSNELFLLKFLLILYDKKIIFI